MLFREDASRVVTSNSSLSKVTFLDPLEPFGRIWRIVVLIELPLTAHLLYSSLPPTPDVSVVCFGHAH